VKPRIYIDTSVFGGYFDEEFKDHTIPLFDRIKNGEFINNSINIKNGYKQLEIRSPREFEKYEES
jgi:hypothetical protein